MYGRGIVGSIILIVFVALLAVPIGVAATIYLQGTRHAGESLLVTNIRNLAASLRSSTGSSGS